MSVRIDSEERRFRRLLVHRALEFTGTRAAFDRAVVAVSFARQLREKEENE